MIQKINHIGIAVARLEEQIPFYRDILGLVQLGIEEIPEQKVRTAMFKVGDINIELLEPTSDESPIAKFLAKRGNGIHHIAYESDGVVQEIEQLEKKGIEMLDRTPREGAHGTLIAFLHPRSSGKILTEICEIKE